jgi:rare lipoprotein A
MLFAGCGTKYSVNYRHEKSQKDSELATKQSSSFKYNMQPYSVFGKTYTPSFVSVGEEFTGTASWYGPDFHNKLTANGETYDMYAETAAHKTLPINTMVKVQNLNNGKSTIVRINDRGPFVEGRIIDLSYTAGKKIGIEHTGTAPVRLTILGFDSLISKAVRNGEKRAVMNYAIQIGAFKQKESAQRFASENSTVDGVYKSVLKEFGTGDKVLFRVFLSGFKSEGEARDFIKTDHFKGSFIINLE